MAQKAGLTLFSKGIENYWEHLPDRAFRADTYNPKNILKRDDKDKKGRSSRRRRNSDPSMGDRRHRDSDRREYDRGDDRGDDRREYDRRDDRGDDRREYDRRDDRPLQEDSRGAAPDFDNRRRSEHQGAYYGGAAGAAAGAAGAGAQQQYPDEYYRQRGPEPYYPSPPQSYSPHPQQPQYTNTNYGPGTTRDGFQDDNTWDGADQYWAQQQRAESPRQYQESQYGTQGRRYNPADYAPAGYYSNEGSGGQHEQMLITDGHARPQSAGPYNRYRPADSSDRHNSTSDRRSRRKDKKERHHDNSSSEDLGGLPRLVHKNLDGTEKGLGAGALGALAGGLLGSEIGKGPIATVAGALLGGLGANSFRAHETKKKEERNRARKDSSRRARSEGRRPASYDEPSYSSRGDATYSNQAANQDLYSDEDEESSDSRDDRRRTKTKSRHDRKTSAADDDVFKWSHTLQR